MELIVILSIDHFFIYMLDIYPINESTHIIDYALRLPKGCNSYRVIL